MRHRLTLAAVLMMASCHAAADVITVAVAANFVKPMRAIADAFANEYPHSVRIVSGSSGKLYAQIRNGAPYDVFFSADQEKPAALEKEKLGHARFTYAIGSLSLWSSDPNLITDGPAVLATGDFDKLSIANPKLAPYGLAAVETLTSLGLDMSARQVQGENIAQTYQFVATGNAALGFVATSQVLDAGGSVWRVPQDLHDPIRQDAVAITAESTAVDAFIAFVKGRESQSILTRFGYHQPCRGS